MSDASTGTPAVYVQTNDHTKNEVLAFERQPDGRLAAAGRFETGGRGTGEPHLASQSSLALSDDGGWLLVVNAGSDELSLFEMRDDGLVLADCVASGGKAPTSVAVHGTLVYVLNSASASIAGFRIRDGRLVALEGSSRPLSAADAAQIAFSVDGATVVVTERGTDSISTYAVDESGFAVDPTTIGSSGKTPYGFDFTPGGAVVTNFGDGTISSYAIGDDGSIELHNPVAGTARLGEKGVRDEAITRDGRYLYVIDTDAQRVFGWSVTDAGELVSIGAFEGVPPTAAGLAAS